MVKKGVIALLLALGASAMASESGVIAYRAQKNLDQGKIARSYSLLERALLATRKESDIQSEYRVLLSMAEIRTMSLDFAFADSLIAMVRLGNLDSQTEVLYNYTKIVLFNARNKFNDAEALCSSAENKALKNSSDGMRASFYSECAIAQAATSKQDKAKKSLKQVDRYADTESGIYAWTEARMADIASKGNIDSLYQVAEQRSIQSNRPYVTATILYHRAVFQEKSGKSEAKELFLRSKNAFELMGLPNNAKRSER